MSAACPVFGFLVHLELLPDRELDVLLRVLHTELLQSRGLVATVLDASHGELVITGDGFQASDSDRDAISGWLGSQPLVARYSVSQLGDVGHAA